ncbi:hypothetical protein HW132_16905 [Brasilonema sp. CT11]|nr:hypothetical protein [Brasilonema sp. CT11]
MSGVKKQQIDFGDLGDAPAGSRYAIALDCLQTVYFRPVQAISTNV